MYKDINILRLIPDRAGRGGTKFGYHAFQQEPILDTRETTNVHVWQDSWRSDDAPHPPSQFYDYYDTEFANVQGKVALSLHGYSKFSLTDPTVGPATELLGHNVRTFGTTPHGYIWNYTTVVDQVPELPLGYIDSNVVCAASLDSPAVFCNIGNRCFIATGIDECKIYDSASGTPTYYSTGLPTVYTLGVGSPQNAPVMVDADLDNKSSGWVHTGSKYLASPDPNSSLKNATPDPTPAANSLELVADGVTWAGATGLNIAGNTDVFDTTGIFVSIPNGSRIATFSGAAIPTVNGWTNLTLTVNGLPFVMLWFGNAATPAPPVTLTASQCYLDEIYRGPKLPRDPNNPGPGGWDPAYDIDGEAFFVTGYRWTMKRTGADLVWAGGVTSPDPVNVTAQLLTTGGALTWDTTPPSYAYAWYDPISGHVSNISPVFSPPATAKTDVGVRINVDAGNLSYPPSTTTIPSGIGATRWTHILFFRTLMAGGSTLYPVGSLDPTSVDWQGLPNTDIPVIPPPGTLNYWYDNARDSDLIRSGALRAPQFTNGKPKIIQNGVEEIISPAHMVFWDGRLWLAGPQDPAAIHYSCDRVQCPFGIPEESFADTNVLRIPASDGCIRGMKLIGESLLITTERWAYTIAGNNEANYRLIRVSTRMAGVGDYQMAEFVPEVAGQTALVVFIGTDAKVYAMPLGGEATPISKDIQTYITDARLTARSTYRLARIHAITTEGRRVIVFYCPAYGGAWGKTFQFDFDSKTWSEHTLTSTTSTTEQGNGVAWATTQSQIDFGSELYAMPDASSNVGVQTGATVRLYQWMNSVSSGFGPQTLAVPRGTIRTFPLNFDGKKTRKRLHFVRLYVNSESGTSVVGGTTHYGWRVRLIKDYGTYPVYASPVQEYDSAYKQITDPAHFPIDDDTDAELIVTDAALSPDTPILGYRFDLQVTFPDYADKVFRLYRLEIGWSTLSDAQEDI